MREFLRQKVVWLACDHFVCFLSTRSFQIVTTLLCGVPIILEHTWMTIFKLFLAIADPCCNDPKMLMEHAEQIMLCFSPYIIYDLAQQQIYISNNVVYNFSHSKQLPLACGNWCTCLWNKAGTEKEKAVSLKLCFISLFQTKSEHYIWDQLEVMFVQKQCCCLSHDCREKNIFSLYWKHKSCFSDTKVTSEVVLNL